MLQRLPGTQRVFLFAPGRGDGVVVAGACLFAFVLPRFVFGDVFALRLLPLFIVRFAFALLALRVALALLALLLLLLFVFFEFLFEFLFLDLF